jgi:DNA-binding transcriptional LysR family regulator
MTPARAIAPPPSSSTTSAEVPKPSPRDTTITAVPASATALPTHHRRPGCSPRMVAQASDFGVLLSLVAAGAGVTLVPELAAGNLPEGVRLLPPAEPVTRQIFTVSRRGGDRKPAVRVVLDALRAAAATPRPAP